MPQKLFETEERRKRALLVSLSSGKDGESSSLEFRQLAETLELDVAAHEIINIREHQPKFGMGSGKAAELAEKAASLNADCIAFDWDLSPSRQRNWEDLAKISVLDRQEVIIQIFAARAATREAELQARLAELIYRLPRLAHKYIDLSRQRGGRYGTKGAGETRLETDRREIEQRIHKLKKEIKEIAKQRETRRRQRERQGLPAIRTRVSLRFSTPLPALLCLWRTNSSRHWTPRPAVLSRRRALRRCLPIQLVLSGGCLIR